MTVDNKVAVSVNKGFEASPERVFEAWLDPAMVMYWFAPGLGEMTRVDIDPRKGGEFHFDQRRVDEIARHWGRYLEIDRPHRLVFTWCVDGADGEDIVAIDIEPTERGCRVMITHRMDARFAEYVDRTEKGWATMTEGLACGLAATKQNGSTVGKNAASLVMTRRFGASPSQIFAAWTDPGLAGQWLFTSPASEKSHHELDARTGGRWTITDHRDGTDYTASGEYLEVDRPRRLVFTFAMHQFSPNSDRITVHLTPDGDGCIMTFTQEGADIAEELRQLPEGIEGGSASGWRQMFDSLAGVMARHAGPGTLVEPGTIRFERLLPGPLERVWAYLTESDKRGQWLAAGAMKPRVGSAFQLNFDHAGLSPTKIQTPERFRHFEGGCATHHEVTRFEPPHVLGLTWGGGVEGPSEVTFELAEEGGRVRLVLTHRRLDAKTMTNVAGGWHTHLAILADKLDGRTPPSFWTLFEGTEQDYAQRIATALKGST